MAIKDVPAGFKDLLPPAARQLREIENKLLDLFRSWSYQEVGTPTVEYLPVFGEKEGEDRLFKLLDRQGRVLALRPEGTTPIARLAASHYGPEDFPLRFCYLGSVFRQGPSQLGGLTEFHQAGVELLGAATPRADTEVIALAVEAMRTAGLEDFRLGLGQVAVTSGLLQRFGLTGSDLTRAKAAIAAKDLVELENILARAGLSVRDRRKVLEVCFLSGGRSALDQAALLAGDDPVLQELEEVYACLAALGLKDYVFFDFSILRDFDYYTGIVFEGYSPRLGQPILGGGRYDRLLQNFDLPAPATGFAMGLERAMVAAPASQETDETILLYGRDYRALLQKAGELRSRGFAVALDLTGLERDEARDLARRQGISRILGEGETIDE